MEQVSKDKQVFNKGACSHYHRKCKKHSSKRRSHSPSGSEPCIHHCKSKKHSKKSRNRKRHSRSLSRSLSDSEYVCSKSRSRRKKKHKCRSRSKSRSIDTSTCSEDDDYLRRCIMKSIRSDESRSPSPPALEKMVSHDSQSFDVFFMLDGEGLSLPIVTDVELHLTNVLLALPLPKPIRRDTSHQSLLSHLKNPEEATQHLNAKESTLISTLIDALDFNSIELIEMKDENHEVGSHSGEISQLLKCVVEKNPVIFNDSMHGFSQKTDSEFFKGNENSIRDNPHELSNNRCQVSSHTTNYRNMLSLHRSCNNDCYARISPQNISDGGSPPSPSQFIRDLSNSSSNIDGSPANSANVIKKPFVELCQSVPNNSLDYSHSEMTAETNVNRLNNSIPNSIAQPSTPESQPNKESQIVSELQNNHNNIDIKECVVMLSKGRPGNQILTEEKRFSEKKEKSYFSPDELSDDLYQNSSKEPSPINKSNNASLSFTTQVDTSSSVTVGSSVPTANIKKNFVAEPCHQDSPPENIAEANVNGIHNSVPDSFVHASFEPGSKRKKKGRVINKMENKRNDTHSRKMSLEECEDLSSKRNLDDQTLATKNGNGKSIFSSDSPHELSDNRHQNSSKEPSYKNKRSFYNNRETEILLSKLSSEIRNFTLSSDRQFTLRNKKCYSLERSSELSDNSCRSASTLSEANSKLSNRSSGFKRDRSRSISLSDDQCDLSSPLSSPNITNSPKIILGPSVQTAHSVKKKQRRSVRNNVFKKSQTEAKNANLNSISDSPAESSNIPRSKIIKRSKISSQLGNNKNNNDITLKPAVIVLSKLSPEAIELALKSARQFILKSRNIGSSTEHSRKTSDNLHLSFRKNSNSSDKRPPLVSSLNISNDLSVSSPSSSTRKPHRGTSPSSSSTLNKINSSRLIIEPLISPINPIEESAVDHRQSVTSRMSERELLNEKSSTNRERPSVPVSSQPVNSMQSNDIELIELSDSEEENNIKYYREDSHVVEWNGPKRRLNSLSEKMHDNISANQERKRRRTRSQLNQTESSNSEDEKMNEMRREVPPSLPNNQSLQPKKFIKKKSGCESLLEEDIMDSNIYQHFYQIVEAIFESIEGTDFATEIDEETETLVPLAQLRELSYEAAKLKRLYSMNQFPPGRLVHLLAILERYIVHGTLVLPVNMLEELEREVARSALDSTMERVMRSVHASLTALYIMTSPKILQQVFLEDVIEKIVIFLKYQLENTIYPVFGQSLKFDSKSNAGRIKQKRFRTRIVKEKSILQLYNDLLEIVSLLTELLDRQTLEETILLQVAAMGVNTFFVEGISELQLKALRTVTILFSRYTEIRAVILQDILASVVSLPTSKKCLKNYRLISGGNIQIFTALVLQLMHSVVRLPEPDIHSKLQFPSNKEKQSTKNIEKVNVDKNILIVTSYEESMKTAYRFLTVFIDRCLTKYEETDYRPLFENFVQDLLTTLNKPEWPASELTLYILGKILLDKVDNTSIELNRRVASLECLGFLSARLRGDVIISEHSHNTIVDVIQRIAIDSGDTIPSTSKSKIKPLKLDNIQILQKALLQYLDSNKTNHPAFQFSYRFYIARWYKDAVNEIKYTDKSLKFQREVYAKSHPVQTNRQSNRNTTGDDKINAQALLLAEEKMKFLLNLVKQQDPSIVRGKKKEHIDYKTAELISQYLASTRDFTKRFDQYLSQILRALSEATVAIRTKAMKCLTLVVEADPNILARLDVQRSVHGRLLDHSISVREATVDLLGKFILIRPELINQYYEMLSERILDIGLSVRKRVIKILKNICLEQSDFPKIPEICVKILRRIDDEDSIRKLVIEVFQSMWFNPISDKKRDVILQKVKNITKVVKACSGTGLEWFEQLLANLLKHKEDKSYKHVLKSCKQISNCLVENLLQLEESSQNEADDDEYSSHSVSCLETLYLFSKIHPPFIVPHAITILSYLTMKSNTVSSLTFLNFIIQILELTVPLIEHPSDTFLAQMEEDIVKLIIRQHMDLLPSCVRGLGVVVNKVTHNYKIVKDCFKQFLGVILVSKKENEKDPGSEVLKSMKPKLLRSLYTVGLFCCYFDFNVVDFRFKESCQISLKETVFQSLMYFIYHMDEDIRLKALTALGFIMIRHYEFMLDPKVKTLYYNLLTSPNASFVLKCQVLKNIKKYLDEEEKHTMQKEVEWSKTSKRELLKEMGDVTSDMASTIIQIYLKQVLECVLHKQVNVRISTLSLIQVIFGQGLVLPLEYTPYVICLGSDDTIVVRSNADELLEKIAKKYPCYIQMKAMLGIRMSYKMQQMIQNPNETIRGFRGLDISVSRNSALYSVLRSNRHNRRGLLMALLKLIDKESRTPLAELLYIADNIAYFPYMVQDEPLFIIHQLDIMLPLSLSISLQTFCEALLPKRAVSAEVEEKNLTTPGENNFDNKDNCDNTNDDFDSILGRLPENTTLLHECIVACQACALLLHLKETLKEMYDFTDNKIQEYSPNATAKVYERPLNRKEHVRFNPVTVLNFIKSPGFDAALEDKGKEELVNQYLHFKQVMSSMDLDDDDDDDDNDEEQYNQADLITSTLTVSFVPNSTLKSVDIEINSKTELPISDEINSKTELPIADEINSKTQTPIANEIQNATEPAQASLEKTKIVTPRNDNSPVGNCSCKNSPKRMKGTVKKKQ